MLDRVASLIGGAADGMQWLGTFHSIGVRVLRRHAELVGLKSNFTILDTDDQTRLIKQLLAGRGRSTTRSWPARTLAGIIQRWKDRGADARRRCRATKPATSPAARASRHLPPVPGTARRALNAVDFGDLRACTASPCGRSIPTSWPIYHGRFRYILVDEYQDTNVAQYLWLRLLAQGTQQCLRAWATTTSRSMAGAAPRWTTSCASRRDFRQRHHRSGWSATTARRRTFWARPRTSSPHNEGRLGKTLWTEGKEGEKIRVAACGTATKKRATSARRPRTQQRAGHKLGADGHSGARLASRSASSKSGFISLGLPYRVIGGPRFYERQEIRDAMAYLRLIAQGDDDLAFERIVNKPKRGIGDAAVRHPARLCQRAQHLPLLAATRKCADTDELPPKARKALGELVGEFRALDREFAHPAAHRAGGNGAGRKRLYRHAEGRQVGGSAGAAGQFEGIRPLDGILRVLAGFLEHVSLVMEIAPGRIRRPHQLMTLHAAKGLEFDTVFLPGWEEGLFPSQRTMDEAAWRAWRKNGAWPMSA